jgi:hypothetical protein
MVGPILFTFQPACAAALMPAGANRPFFSVNALQYNLYLTPFGAGAAEVEDRAVYISYSYSQIAGIVKSILALHRNSINDKVASHLADYLTTIKRDAR